MSIEEFLAKLKINGGTIQQNAGTAVKNCKISSHQRDLTVTLAAFLRF